MNGSKHMSEDSDKNHSLLPHLAPNDWDMRPFSVVSEIRNFLRSIKDEGTNVDSAMGDGVADLWVTIDGVEFYIKVSRSNLDKSKHP